MAQAWADGAALAYGPLARHLVARTPVPLSGSRALDAGAGSGAAGAALRAGGAQVVAADRELDMATYAALTGPAVTADVMALPFRERSFDVVVAAFVVNHLAEPVLGLAELRRVARPGGVVLVSTFSEDRAPAKGAVDLVAADYGFVQPEWYLGFRETAEAFGDAATVERAMSASGFEDWTVTEEPVDVGLVDSADVVRYRLGMPHLHRFAAGLAEDVRVSFIADATEAVRRTRARFAPVVVEAVART
jgi:ubiquinone/menaquinone biosynthesis C-methylase UbiE